METLTPRQADTLNCIKNFMVSNGYPPTVREIAQTMGVSSPATIQVHLDLLAKKGYIKNACAARGNTLVSRQLSICKYLVG